MTQKDALTILSFGHTTFLTGEAGSGKSYVLREYRDYLKSHGISYALTASTGIAATHIGGMTIHSWSGIGIREFLTRDTIADLCEKEPLYKRWNSVKVLIIDEISMISASFLTMLDMLAREMRRSDAPFGGVQVVFCGDFFQLPPVVKKEKALYESDTALFAFQSPAWRHAKPVVCYLTEQYRQENDGLTNVLLSIRSGDIDEGTYELLQERSVPSKKDETLRLYTHNVDVDSLNDSYFQKLKGEMRRYTMTRRGPSKFVETLVASCLAHDVLYLKEGTKVICVKNDPERKYVNGSLGVVTGFDKDDMPRVLLNSGREITMRHDSWRVEDDGKVKAEISQIPLRYAWAITIHKSQGMTLDEAEVDLSKVFTPGMGYVALSRLRTLEGLHLTGFHPDALLLSPYVRDFDSELKEKSNRAEQALLKLSSDEREIKKSEAILRFGGHIEEAKVEDEEEPEEKVSTFEETRRLLEKKMTLSEIAKERGLTVDTVVGHIEKLSERGELPSVEHLLPKKAVRTKVTNAFKEVHEEHNAYKLSPTYEKLKGVIDYHTLRLVRTTLD